MRILLVLDFYLPHAGGTETMFANLIEQYTKQGHEVHVITSKHNKKLPTVEQVSPLLRIYRKGKGRKGFARTSRKMIYTCVRSYKYNIVHASVYAGAPAAIFWSQRYNIPCILTVHEIFGSLRYRYKKGISARLHHSYEKLLVQYSYTRIHCVSLYTYNSLRIHYGIEDKRLHIIRNGVNNLRSATDLNDKTTQKIIQKFAMQDTDIFLLYYGHSGISKGIDYLIQALPTILEKHKNIHMIRNLIHAQRDNYIRQKIREIPYASRIHISRGMPIDELKHLVAQADVVIAPSLSEGFGSVHSETTAIGTPLITTHIGPLPEVLGGKIYRIQPSSTQSIIQAVDKFVYNHTHKQQHPTFPQQTHSRKHAADKLLQLYGDVTRTSKTS